MEIPYPAQRNPQAGGAQHYQQRRGKKSAYAGARPELALTGPDWPESAKRINAPPTRASPYHGGPRRAMLGCMSGENPTRRPGIRNEDAPYSPDRA